MNPNKIKKDFPIFDSQPGLVYCDSAATSLKPRSVIDALTNYYSNYSANVHRGIYDISEKASEQYEQARKTIADFISVSENEIVFTRNATEGFNLIAYSLGRELVQSGDEIVTTITEHHANFVPWQQLCFELGADFKVIDEIDIEGVDLSQVITAKTKIFAFSGASNVLGNSVDVVSVVKKARLLNPSLIIIVDMAQMAPHTSINVGEIDADFISFSGHKMLGPTGIGVLWGKEKALNSMFPFMYGGDMIDDVRIESSTFQKSPFKFEAGTPHIAGAIGLAEAVKYLSSIGLSNISKHESMLGGMFIELAKKEFGDAFSYVGSEQNRTGIVAFELDSCHAHDIAQILSDEDVCVRAGHHCAMPLHRKLGLSATTRASFYIYNTEEDVVKAISALKNVYSIFS